MLSSDLWLTLSLAGYVAGQGVQDVAQHGSARTNEPTNVSVTLTPPHIQLAPKDVEQLLTAPYNTGVVGNVKALPMVHGRDVAGLAKTMTDGQTTTFTIPISDTEYTVTMTASAIEPINVAATINCSPCIGPIEMQLHEDEENLTAAVSYDGWELTTVKDVRELTAEDKLTKRTPDLPRPTVTVLQKEDELSTLIPPMASQASMETVYVTVTVDYGQRITSTQPTDLDYAANTESSEAPTITTTVTLDHITATVTLDRDALDTKPTGVSPVTTTMYVAALKVHHEPSTTFPDTPKPTGKLSYVGHKFTGFVSDIFDPETIIGQIVWATVVGLLLYMLAAGCWACYTGKSKRRTSVSSPGTSTKSRDAGRRLNTIPENSHEGGIRGEQDDTNARGTASRRAEEGRGRAGLPGGQTTGGGEPGSNQPGQPGTVVEEVRTVEVGHPATVVEDLNGPLARGQLDGAGNSRTGSRVADTGSLRGRTNTHF